MTAEQLSRHLAQSTDRSNFCAGEPPVEAFNMETTDISQERESRPEQSNFDDYQGTPTLPPTVHQAIIPANPTQPPQCSRTVDPYYTRNHIAYTNNYHQCPSNSSVLAINHTVPAMPTSQNHSLHHGLDANQRFPPEQSTLISSQPIVSAPFDQHFPTAHNLVGSVFHPTQIAQASLHSVNANRPTAPSPYTPATTSLAFPVQPNSNIYTTAQPVSQPEMLTSHWRSHPPPQYVSNACIKLPPIQIPKFDGDPLAFHDWINIFKASVHDNTSISQTHRRTYLQNSVSGKAKDLIRGYSCNPAFYNVALAELESRFGSPQHIVTAYIHRLENWAHISSQNPHTLVSFFTFLKQLVQTFINLRFTADLQSSTVLTIAKEKLPHNLLLKWTEHTVKNNILSPTLLDFQQWLEIQARVLEAVEPNLPRPNKPSVPLPGSSSPSQYTQKKQNECSLCHQHHSITRCPQYLDSSIQDRIHHVQSLHLCFNCLGQSRLKKDFAPRPTAASNLTAVLCTTRPSTPLIPKTNAPT